ncbi:N-acetyltransferase [Microbacterium immunditiarum]|uniref:N-acetyltransferase n=1 Tax=Microbacterium immunditiarum TaxID=337480 RepID=A0A7Y9GMB4_9MICO|nr:hypothetical protein [Microbacterium immunditiarum]
MPFLDPNKPVPEGFRTADFVLRPILASDVERDHAAVMETRDELRLWEQTSWPEDDFTVDANRADLEDLERRHLERRAFTYTVLDPEGDESLGCVYIFPIDATFLTKAEVARVGDDRWEDLDAVVYFWVRTSRSASGMDADLVAALRGWLAREWGFERTGYVTNEQYVRQVELLESAGLTVQFELREPGKAGAYMVFA